MSFKEIRNQRRAERTALWLVGLATCLLTASPAVAASNTSKAAVVAFAEPGPGPAVPAEQPTESGQTIQDLPNSSAKTDASLAPGADLTPTSATRDAVPRSSALISRPSVEPSNVVESTTVPDKVIPPNTPVQAGPSALPQTNEGVAPTAPPVAPIGPTANPYPRTGPLLQLQAPVASEQMDQGGGQPNDSQRQRGRRILGAMLDVGFPDGVMVGAAYRPWSWIRVQAGAGSNAVSAGVRGGLVLVPFGVGPSLTIEGGNYFDGDANGIASQFVGPSYENNQTAQQVGYQFANGHLGLEFGQEVFTFFVHGGMSYVRAELHNVNDVLGGQTNNPDGTSTSVTVNGDPVIRAWFPSFKLGFLIHIV